MLTDSTDKVDVQIASNRRPSTMSAIHGTIKYASGADFDSTT